MNGIKIGLTLLALAGEAALAADAPAGPYHLLKEIHIGGDARWDYLSVDATARRLYVSHGASVEVIDLDQNAVIGTITDTPGVHGFAVVPGSGRGFASDGGEAQLNVIDLKTLHSLGKVATGKNPDAILYEPGRAEIYAFNGGSNSATVVNANSDQVVATVALSGKPEFAATDGRRVYDNIEDKNAVAVIDTAKHRVAADWPAAPCEAASGLAVDTAHQRLFLGCRNRLLAMMAADSGQVVATVPIAGGVDATAFDPATQLAFASCGEGTVTIAHEDSPATLRTVQTLQTVPGARTMALDPKTHRIYLSAAEAMVPVAAGSRPQYRANTFKVLVYGTD
jgi:YVTN family beta-propeller protein